MGREAMEKYKWIDLAREVLETEIQGIRQVQADLGDEFVRALELLAGCSGRVVVSGVGKSGLVGRKIAATFSSTGTPSYFLHPVEGAHGDLGMIKAGDVVIGISNSGETDELNAILPTLISLGAKVIGLTGNPQSTLAGICHICISTGVPKEACPLGLAPTASTTATLAMGDALAVALIEWKSFGRDDFQRFHPGGDLGRQLRMIVSRLMHVQGLPVVRSGATLEQALTVLDQGGLGTVVIVSNEDRLLGILTDGDVRRLVCRGSFSRKEPVDVYMTRNPHYAGLDEKGALVLERMEKSAIMVLPVVNKDRVLQGVVHLHDLLGKGRVRFQ
ncbi:MAG: KpsF/GutQ family sugar-phosphate isomerase [Desulfohalobiaceae bacterium]|nr:KpsF/GutQ family sugar-phosphate isomerase [Desulfohalobiaceae bacterium]